MAAAVPLVQITATCWLGALAIPSAKKAAPRSSNLTWSSITPRVLASCNAIERGAFLEPGEITKSLTPNSINLRMVWRARSVALLTLPPFAKSRFPNSFNAILPPKSTVC